MDFKVIESKKSVLDGKHRDAELLSGREFNIRQVRVI